MTPSFHARRHTLYRTAALLFGLGGLPLLHAMSATARDQAVDRVDATNIPEIVPRHFGQRLADFFERSLEIRLVDDGIRSFVHASPFPGLDVLPTQLSFVEEDADALAEQPVDGGVLRRIVQVEAVPEHPAPHEAAARIRRRTPGTSAYLTSFQKAAFSLQAMKVKPARKSSTHTPMRTRVFCAGSPIHCR